MSRVLPAHVVVVAAPSGSRRECCASRSTAHSCWRRCSRRARSPRRSRRGSALVAASRARRGVALGGHAARRARPQRARRRIGRAGDGVVVTTAEARTGTFAQRQFARRGRSTAPAKNGSSSSCRSAARRPRAPASACSRSSRRPRARERLRRAHLAAPAGRARRPARRPVARRRAAGRARRRRRPAAGVAATRVVARSRGRTARARRGGVLGDDNGLSDGLKQAFAGRGCTTCSRSVGENVVLLAGGVLAARRCWSASPGVGPRRCAGRDLRLRARGRPSALGDPGRRLGRRGLDRVAPRPAQRTPGMCCSSPRSCCSAGTRTRCSTPASSSRSPPCWRSSSSAAAHCGCSRGIRCPAAAARAGDLCGLRARHRADPLARGSGRSRSTAWSRTPWSSRLSRRCWAGVRGSGGRSVSPARGACLLGERVGRGVRRSLRGLVRGLPGCAGLGPSGGNCGRGGNGSVARGLPGRLRTRQSVMSVTGR